MCDNCRAAKDTVVQDLTKAARDIVQTVMDCSNSGRMVTLLQVQSILTGASNAESRQKGWSNLPSYGATKHLKDVMHRLFMQLFSEGILLSDFVVEPTHGRVNEYIKVSSLMVYHVVVVTAAYSAHEDECKSAKLSANRHTVLMRGARFWTVSERKTWSRWKTSYHREGGSLCLPICR